MKKKTSIIMVLIMFVILLSSFSFSFPASLVGEEIGRAYGFPIPWHVKDAVSLGRIVWGIGLLVNIVTCGGVSICIGYFMATPSISSQKKRGFKILIKMLLGIGAALLFLMFVANFMDPSFRMFNPV